MAKKAERKQKRLRVTWVKSTIGCARDQRGTIRALGLRRLNHSVMHDDTAVIRGMVFKVKHLVRVEEVEA